MDNPGYVAMSRLAAQQRNVDTIAQNLANVGTPGFRASRLLFDTWVAQQAGIDRPGGRSVAFAQDRASFRDHAMGTMTRTDNPLDIAITGEAFFVIDTPRGERFTRAGRFTIAPDGRITTSEGYALMDTQNRPLVVTAQDTRLTVAPDGTLESENGPIGRIRLVDFADRNLLRPEGDVLFVAQVEPEPAVDAKLVQGMVEESNVQPILEMTRLMSEVREFQFVTQFVEREGERQTNAIERLTRRRN